MEKKEKNNNYCWPPENWPFNFTTGQLTQHISPRANLALQDPELALPDLEMASCIEEMAPWDQEVTLQDLEQALRDSPRANYGPSTSQPGANYGPTTGHHGATSNSLWTASHGLKLA